MPSKQLINFEKALAKFREMLARDASDDAVRDAAIQRFEFTYEICWKALKHHLALRNVVSGSPKDVIAKAAHEGWIVDPSLWSQVIKDRNLTSHIYNEAVATAIFGRLPKYLAEFDRIVHGLRKLEGVI